MAIDEQDEQSGARALRLRALAHPIRWKLIDLVAAEGSATATRCAEVLGESVASCSYHLGILGKYGYMERVPDSVGREKPWRVTTLLQSDLSVAAEVTPDDDETGLAAVAAADAFLDKELARIKNRMHAQGSETPEWQATHVIGVAAMYVTASELAQIKDELTAILHRYAERADDPALRPAGARSAHVFVSTSVDPPSASGVRK